jgi:hypothetical protein
VNKTISRFLALGALAPLFAVFAACGGSGTPPTPVTCGSETRERVDCSSEVSYQGANIEGGFGVTQIVSANAKHEEVALRRVDEETERFIAMQTRLCRDYNACVLDKDTYQREARAIRDRVGKIPELAQAVKNAKTDDDRKQALDELYRGTVRDEYRVEEITFRMAMKAALPKSLGGEEIAVRPGAPIPTGARVAFDISVSKDAHLYIFQKSPDGGVTVLFPNQRIGTANPLKAQDRVTIPPDGKRFVVNDKDLGLEHIYIAVSKDAIPNLAESLRKAASADATSIKDDDLLQSFTALDIPAGQKCDGSKQRALQLEGDPPASGGGSGCTRQRGLSYEDDARGGGGGSIAARTEPGDSRIVKVFPFEHTTEPDYLAKRQQGGGGKPKTREAVMLE